MRGNGGGWVLIREVVVASKLLGMVADAALDRTCTWIISVLLCLC
jgi:hypothetical protein